MSQWSTQIPDPQPPMAGPTADDGRSQRQARLWRWGTVILIVAMVAGPLAVTQVPREIALWHAAAALEARLNGKPDEASASLEKALRWDPRNATLYLQRAAWRRQAGQFAEALQDCDRAIQLAPWNHLAYVERSQVRQHLKMPEQAVTDWKKVAELNENRPLMPATNVWNGLAYARAVAGIELEQGLEDIQRAVQREPGSAGILDTRGYLYLKLGKPDEAIKDLDQAVELSEQQLVGSSKLLEQPRSPIIDRREAAEGVKLAAMELAVILYHRSLVLDKLDQEAAAAADRDRVRQLGFDPSDELF